MRHRGEHRIGARADTVWLALNDPEVLLQCLDGCQSLARVGDNAYAAIIKMEAGPLNEVFHLDIRLIEADPPYAFALEADIDGRVAGAGHGSVWVWLLEERGETALRYAVEGRLAGKFAQAGQRLAHAGARRLVDDFFIRLGRLVAPQSVVRPATSGIAINPAHILVTAIAIAGLFLFLQFRNAPARARAA